MNHRRRLLKHPPSTYLESIKITPPTPKIRQHYKKLPGLSCMSGEHWREPLPRNHYKPGDIVQSPGNSFAYEILSYPFCRLYWGNGKPEPDMIESAWQPKNPAQPELGWKKRGANFLSYRVRLLEGEREFEWTDRGLKRSTLNPAPDDISLAKWLNE